MTHSPRQASGQWRRARAAAGVAVAAAAAVGSLAAPAEAHAALQTSSPGADTVTDVAPEALRLTFDEPVLGIGAHVVLTGPDGSSRDAVSIRTNAADVISAFRAVDAPGRYRVSWRVVADDGHPETGSFAFTYAPPTLQPRQAAPITVTPQRVAATPASVSRPPRPGPGVPWGTVGVGVVAVLGVIAVRRLRSGAP